VEEVLRGERGAVVVLKYAAKTLSDVTGGGESIGEGRAELRNPNGETMTKHKWRKTKDRIQKIEF